MEDFRKYGSSIFIRSASGSLSYADFSAKIDKYAAALAASEEQSFGLHRLALADQLALMIAIEASGRDAVLLNSQSTPADIETFSKLAGFRKVYTPENLPSGSAVAGPARSGRILLTTSGSTGTPKVVARDRDSLLRGISKTENGSKAVWLLTYEPTSFAGLQVILHAMMNGAQLVEAGQDPAEAIRKAPVTHISATPSFWRKILIQLRRASDLPYLKQITLGGEAVTQELLDQLVKTFPHAGITHIYASTEMGACFYVKDKKAGIPAMALTENPKIQGKVESGELFLKSERAMGGYEGKPGFDREGWFATGDMVREENGRIYFAGRKENILNVGGYKVYPYEVEEVIYEVPGVLHVKVSGQVSSVLGQIVKAELEVRAEEDEADIKRKVQELCRQRLAPAKVPRVIEIRTSLVRGGKVDRRES